MNSNAVFNNIYIDRQVLVTNNPCIKFGNSDICESEGKIKLNNQLNSRNASNFMDDRWARQNVPVFKCIAHGYKKFNVVCRKAVRL